MEDACERLTEDPRVDARRITVAVKDKEITLDGHVASRFEKRDEEDCVEAMTGVNHVQNNLRIAEPGDGPGMSDRAATRG